MSEDHSFKSLAVKRRAREFNQKILQNQLRESLHPASLQKNRDYHYVFKAEEKEPLEIETVKMLVKQ